MASEKVLKLKKWMVNVESKPGPGPTPMNGGFDSSQVDWDTTVYIEMPESGGVV